jgi:hypothetical protein
LSGFVKNEDYNANGGNKMNSATEVDEVFGEVIDKYTREMAIENGDLIDVTMSDEWVEAGFKCPVALTRMVWYKYVEVPEGVWDQDQKGRLWDILYLFSIAAKSHRQSDTMYFQLYVRNSNREGLPPLVTLKGVCGPDDNGDLVITIMEKYED